MEIWDCFGQDGKILFLRYGNFIRRVPLDHIIPAEEYNNDADEELIPKMLKIVIGC